MATRSAVVRLAVMWCPHWPVVAAGPGPPGVAGSPVAVLHANRVVAHCRLAGADGVRVGQRRREAQAASPHVRLVAHDPARDARAFEPIVAAVTEMVPRVEIADPGTLAFVARGPSRYFGGDEAMARRVVTAATAALGAPTPAVHGSAEALQRAGGFGLGIADGRFAAGVAARLAVAGGAPVVVASGKEATAGFLAPLTVRFLSLVAGLDAGLTDLLSRLGLHHLGDLAALPAADVLARFGRAGELAHALATGVDGRLPGVADAPPGLSVQHELDEPVQRTDVLVFVARQLAEQLVAALAAGGQVCTRLAVVAQTEHGEHSERIWYRDTGLGLAAIVERVRWQLDAWVQHGHLTAGVTLLRLEPVEVRAGDGVQLDLWGGRSDADEWAARAIARLVTLAGEQQVLVPAAAGGRHPAEDYSWVPASSADLAHPAERLAAADGPWPGRLPSPSPAVLHATPLPLAVLAGDGGEVQVSGRGVVSGRPVQVRVGGGAPEDVVAWAGPWPVEERWWDSSRARRVARFQLLTASGRLLLAVVEARRWQLVAEYA